MERILVVDDNKALAKLIVMQMEKSIEDMAIDVAYDFAEAQMLISEHGKDYFMTILDLIYLTHQMVRSLIMSLLKGSVLSF